MRWVGLWQLGAPLHHGAPVGGAWLARERARRGLSRNHAFLRQEPVGYYDPVEQRMVMRPCYCLAGNAVRGMLRSVAARYTLQALGLPREPGGLKEELGWRSDDEVFLLFKGGPMKAASGVEDVRQRRELRSYLPLVEVFGGWYRGEGFEGALWVGNAWPAVRELAFSQPWCEGLLGARGLTWDMLPRLEELRVAVEADPACFARHMTEELVGLQWDDKEDKARDESGGEETEEGEAEGPGQAGQEGEEEKEQKLRGVFSMDALPAGLLLFHELGLKPWASERAEWCLGAALHLWQDEYGGIAGGGAGRGLGGRVVAEYQDADGRAVDLKGAFDRYAGWLAEHRQEILAYLRAMPERFAAPDKKRRRR
ncbi:MAG: hypothetical protein ACOY3F_07545 [Bacillota bacterium]